MHDYRITMTCKTTSGLSTVTTDPFFGWGEASDHLEGMIAAVGEENVVRVVIRQDV